MRLFTLLAAAALARPITARVPEFPEGAAWINSKPFTMKQLKKRKVTLIFFFHTADLHSIRAAETVKVWYKRYELHGLHVIGVHSPEYGFQKDPVAVRRDLKRFGIDFPVILDNNRDLWNGYGNGGWPAFYIVDPRGDIISERLGENGYPAIERELREQLELYKYEPPTGDRLTPDPPAFDCGGATAETSAGMRRGGKLIDLDNKNEGKRIVIGEARDGELATAGLWDSEPDNVRLAQNNLDQSAFVRVVYRGAQAFAVLAPASGGSKYWLRQDDLWLHAGNAGSDVEFDDDGRSYLKADRSRLYHLTTNGTDQFRQLSVIPDKRSSAIYGFSFTNRCLAVKLPPP